MMSGSSLFYLLLWYVAYTVQSRVITIKVPDDDHLSEFPIATETTEESFIRSDQNHDDKLTFDEYLHMELLYEQMKKQEFERLDLNHDGFLSRSELDAERNEEQQKVNKRQEEYFRKLYEEFDRNHDLKLSLDEVIEIMIQRFALKPRSNFPMLFETFDENHDGGLQLSEYIKFDENIPFEEMDPLNDSGVDGDDDDDDNDDDDADKSNDSNDIPTTGKPIKEKLPMQKFKKLIMF